MKIKTNEKFAILCLIGGLLFSFLFYKSSLGINVPIFTVYALLLFILSCKYNNVLTWNYYWLITIPIILLSFRFFTSMNEVINFFNFLMIIFLFITMSTMIYLRKTLYDNFNSLIFHTFHSFVVPFKFIKKPFLAFENSFIVRKTNKKLFKYSLLGILFTIPFIAIILSLLMSADSVFKTKATRFLEYISFNSISDIIFFIFFAVFAFILLFTFIYYINKKKEEISNTNVDKTITPFIPPEIYIIPLISLTLIYGLFTFIQFTYLFGHPLSLPADITYAQYARNGFFELALVSIISFFFILLGVSLNKSCKKISSNIIKVMQLIVVGLTSIMLYSSFYRMNLYENEYGYTMLRFMVYFFLAFEVFLLVFLVLKITKKEFKLLRYSIITAIVLFTIFNYVNPDAYIAKMNIDRYYETGKIDNEYLFILSKDALPQIERLIKSNDDLSPIIVDKINDMYSNDNLENRRWQEYNLSETQANNIYLNSSHP